MSNFNPQFQRIGDILVHNGVISQDDLTRALDDQKTSNEKIGAILIKLGCINEDELIDAYSQQMGKKPIDIEFIKCFLNKNLSLLQNLNLEYRETQIFRRNETNLDCDRHFKVFNEFKMEKSEILYHSTISHIQLINVNIHPETIVLSFSPKWHDI